MIAKKEFKILVFTFFLLIATLIFQSSFSISKNEEYFSYVDSIDYTESLEVLRNPERGFYTPIEIAITTPKPTSKTTSSPAASQSTNNNKNEQESPIENGETVTEPSYEGPKGNQKYQIYYYYDNVRDKTQTLTLYSPIGSIIDFYTDRVREGYVLDKAENYPLTVTENANENIMKIYYVKESEEKKEPEKTPNINVDKEDSKSQGVQDIKQKENQKKPTKKNQVVTTIALIFDSLLFLIIITMVIRLILRIKNERV